MKRTLTIGLGLFGVMVLAACGGVVVPGDSLLPSGSSSASRPASSATPTPAPSSAPPATLWAGPTDGTWDFGDFELGQPVTARLSDYSLTFTSAPVFGPIDDGNVEVVGTLSVQRVEDRGHYDTITEAERIGFVPGNLDYQTHSEVYGLNTRFECENDDIAVGETTRCTVAFVAPSDEMQDFHWWVSGASAAAWPGQKAG